MATEKLILLDDVESLGLAGEEVTVAPGYARNFLLPRKLAMKASPAAMRVFEARREKIEEQRKDELLKAQTLAAKLKEMEIEIAVQAGDDDQLYGSVTDRTIADKLHELGVELEHHKIKLEEHIKTLGKFDVEIKLHPEVRVETSISVVRS